MTIAWPGKHGFWVWVLLIPLLNSASAQPGFISIDCGATANSTDSSTGIQWTTDAPYISTGTNQFVDRDVVSPVNMDQLKTLRSFPPNRSKHCYTLPATSNTTYLIRVVFFHGGFQAAVDNSFNISIDSNIVDGASYTDADIDGVFAVEYVVATDLTSNVIYVCLLPNGTTAFINTLELRPLEIGMYDVVYNGNYLRFLYRLNNGAAVSDPSIRYPDDPYDRIWYTPGSNLQTIQRAQTSRDIPPSQRRIDRVPLKVLQSAWYDPTAFWFSFIVLDSEVALTTKFYLNLFFAEVQTVKATDVRAFSIQLNGESYWDNVTVGTTSGLQLFNKDQTLSSGTSNFSFQILPGAALGPVLNGAEGYSIRPSVLSSTDVRDVNALEVLKASLGLSSWTGDPCFPVAYSWITCDSGAVTRVTAIKLSNYSLTGTIPASIADIGALTDLWLDNNQIQGAIPDLSQLTKLETLHLQNNLLSGGIPSTLASLTLLTELFLENNKFSGPIPAGVASKSGLNLQTSGNANLCAPTANCPVLPVDFTNSTGTNVSSRTKKGGGSTGAIIGGIVGALIVAIILIGLLVAFCRRKPRKPAHEPASTINGGPDRNGASAGSTASAPPQPADAVVRQTRAFTLREVEVATNNYKTRIGEGGFGLVFYGRLPEGTEVAVKVNSETSAQGEDEFGNEVSTLSRVHHRNLVSLLGYCEENEQQILIYEFMPKGTLREHLYGRDIKGRIGWKERLDIALNAARGLEYLHNDCIPKIIHRDIKSNNILLDDKLLAKVADFGISKLAPEGDSVGGVSTIVKGTRGYLDPEYYKHNRLTQKSDVYSFGVVLLEIICARPPTSGEYILVDWARGQLNSNDLESIIDPFIRGKYNLESMWKVAELAMGCVEPYGIQRPDMGQVVRALSQAAEFQELKTQTHLSSSQQWTPPAEQEGSYRDYSETSYPPTQGSYGSTSEYSSHSGNPGRRFTQSRTLERQLSDTRDSGDSRLAPQPR